MQDFTLAMCVYFKDDGQNFRLAVESIYEQQTLKPSEIVIVVDGPVYDELDSYLSSLEAYGHPYKIVRLPENLGHAGARQVALKSASNEIVAIMDADDISLPDRFEKTMSYMDNNPDVAVVGGQIEEFIGNPNNIVGKREVPLSNQDIHNMLKSRCPFNQMSVIFRRNKINGVGGYQDWYCDEDYYLWIRMAEAGYKFANLPDTLVNVRVGKDMYARRGGWKYFKSEKGLQDYMFKKKMISLPRYCYNVLGRFIIQVVMPNTLRAFVFQKLFRK